MKKWIIILTLPIVLIASTWGKFIGKVVDSKTREPLVGVEIRLIFHDEFTGRRAISNERGGFFIASVDVEDYDLVFSMKGYKTKTLSDVHMSLDMIVDLGTIILVPGEDFDTEVSTEENTPTIQLEEGVFEKQVEEDLIEEER